MEPVRIKPEWAKSKEEIWKDVFEPLMEQKGEQGNGKTPVRRLPFWSYAAILLAFLSLTIHLYTVTEKAERGEHAEIGLPDNSTVTLNAGSKLSYKPLEWFILRKATLEGEACFEVKPGSRFSVQSGSKRVYVLGTTFNVYARPGKYCVTCLDGQVEVSIGKGTATLTPGMQAIWRGEKLEVGKKAAFTRTAGWMQGKFEFTETPLPEVIAEVERQYDIHVMPGYRQDYLYTGNFSKTERPEGVLEIIGKPFGITFNILGR
ncbi:MAG: FecR domain-containing protein [Tannerellaceae bacterium]|jgi:ferric-dicitrate binding protein FerR (iron transport regulator)|nr:FecR domain-containing protein [Tannerellaceae bacterium]